MPEALLEKLTIVRIIIQIVIGLGFLIFIHEAGHFLIAKWKGVRVDAFSLGMGPILWKRFWRGTEYRISVIPLGGYVKMAGENIGDPTTGAPDELTSKSGFARLQIFAAGALMNLFIAFPLAILACLAGRSEAEPVIGWPSQADILAKIKPGDRILSVGGRKVESLNDYQKMMVSASQGKPVDVVVSRDGVEMTFPVTVMGSKNHQSAPPPTTLPKIATGSPAWNAGLRSGTRILQVNGKPPSFDPTELADALSQAAVEGPVTMLVHVPGEEQPKQVVLKDLPVRTDAWIPKDYRLIEPVIDQPEPGTPAAQAGLQAGDIILRIGSRPIATFDDIFREIGARPGQNVAIEYKRGSATQTTTVLVLYRSLERGMIGVGPGKTPRIVQVADEPKSPFHKAGLQSGDVLVTIDTIAGPAAVDIAKGRSGPAKVQIRRGQEILEYTIPAEERRRLNFEEAGFLLTDKGNMALKFNTIDRKWAFGPAVAAGLNEPIEVIGMTFKILGKLFVREEDPSGLAGPVGIFKASFFHAQAGMGNFLWLLVLITVNLGIFNLLPVPVLDGGHILLLAIEKIKGGPPSPRFVERFQLVGLILLLSLLIFVTVNDLR